MITQVECEVRAYSPQDKIDETYHAKHGNSRTASGTSSRLPGVASAFPRGTQVIVKGYNSDRATSCDDSGSAIRRRARQGKITIEVRFQSEDEALEWGVRKLIITVIYP